MAPLVNRLIGVVRPEAYSIGTCLVCHGSIEAGDESVRLTGGGRVHTDCATYRMRHRGRPQRRPAAEPRRRYTGD